MTVRLVKGRPGRHHSAVTLVELMISLTIMTILFNIVVPGYRRTVEQAGVDLAGGNLNMIWTAQRMYWVEHGTYASDLGTLLSDGLLDRTSPPGSGRDRRFAYSIQYADDETFVAAASRLPGEPWTGTLTINESGTLEGGVSDFDQLVLQAYSS